MRLDSYLVQEGLAKSKTQAQNMIQEGLVQVSGKQAQKSSLRVDPDGADVYVQEHIRYVSRAAWKLAYFLDEIVLDVKGLQALDIGASTGGFTQVFLERGALHVTCVDVGKEQLDALLREDTRVSVHESCDIRSFVSKEMFDLVSSDVSFISLLHILDAVDRLAKKEIILLFKPQFEVGKDVKRDRNGVVTDKKAIALAMERFEAECQMRGWHLMVKSPAKITGKEGNLEYCYYYTKI
jgi:23S rRNA (cytidine1920-2'-O)/16S rRNA (cytidine1409-2'-O)-methyltransferase